MLDLFTTKKPLDQQKPSEKMTVLKLVAKQKLGGKWEYFHKIKHAGENFSFLKEANLVEQMKATQAALRYSSKNVKKAMMAIYKNTIIEIKKNTDLSNFPPIPEGDAITLTPEQDATLIQWSPIKFMLPSRMIREKGVATPRHSEGLVAKFYFKVAGFYAVPENWNHRKLTHYLYKINSQSTYQDITNYLEPLKKDLAKFAENYELFKFGKASLAKDASQDMDSFDDAMGLESFEDEIRTLYWYHFIYQGLENFLFRYYITLVTSTDNLQAVRYLSAIFEPAISRAIEVKTLFLGSFETDSSKKKYIKAYEDFKLARRKDPLTTELKTKKATYETYVYNLPLLEKYGLDYNILEVPGDESEWSKIVKHQFLGFEPPILDRLDEESDPEPEGGKKHPLSIIQPVDDANEAVEFIEAPLEVRRLAMLQVLNMLVECNRFRKQARQSVLELFRDRVKKDREIAQKRIVSIRGEGEKKIREMERKVAKLKRMKQDDSVKAFEEDIARFKTQVTDKCNTIIEDAKYVLQQQKVRLQRLFDEINKETMVPDGIASHVLLELTREIDKEGEFVEDFTKYVIQQIQMEYRKDLEPFYQNLFSILEPSTQEKVMLIQALEKSGGADGVKLTLDEKELEQIDDMVAKLKTKIMQTSPDIFESKLIFATTIIPINDLFEISIDNKSLGQLLKLKVTSPRSPRPAPIRPVTVKALMVLNLVKNPIPTNNLIQEGREGIADPTKVINSNLLHKLLAELASR